MIGLKKKQENYLIKNTQVTELERHFSWNVASVIWFLTFLVAGIAAYLASSAWSLPGIAGIAALASPLILFATLLLARWEVVFIVIISTGLGSCLTLGSSCWTFLIFSAVGSIGGLMFQIAKEWERAVVLRLGKFKKIKGPGLFLVLPFIDTIARRIDLRIRVTDFAAETVLTRDSVPVTVDALCFWLVWDAEKAMLEVENYFEAVVLSSQTALRTAVSSNDLSTLLTNGEKFEDDVRKEVERKTTEWGITIQHVEITQIEIPDELEKAMSSVAQAEREGRARILLSEAEKEVARNLDEASRVYRENPAALRLKNLSVLQEGFKNGAGLVVVPSHLPEELGQDDVFGLKALNEMRGPKGKPNAP